MNLIVEGYIWVIDTINGMIIKILKLELPHWLSRKESTVVENTPTVQELQEMWV